MGWKRFVKGALAALVAVTLAAACTSGDDSSSSDTTAGGGGSSTETTVAPTGPAPGVTDDSIKVGVTFVDTEALVASGLNYDLGDHEAVYNALFDAINEDGGINGRQIEPVFAPIDPTNPAPAEAKCVELTEDEDVFVVTGFFLADAVNCVVSTHATAVAGGEMTPERIEGAEAPWITWTPDTDQPEAVLRTMDEQGELNGTVGVWVAERDQAVLDNQVLPLLDELGVDVAATATAVAPADDQAAQQAEQTTIAQNFEAAGVDTVVLIGTSAQGWPTIMAEDTSYRPKLLFLDILGARAFYTNAATTDTTVLEGAVMGGGYGPDQARFDEPAMQECIQTLADHGVETPTPEESGDDPSNQPYQAAFQACPDVALLAAWLEAAGDDLNYGTLTNAINGLEVSIPGDPEARTYGPPPDADGNPTAYLYTWDEDAQDVVIQEG
ncbi:MAG TPA: ABC transporter substrate-binding protein [Acidimicrobiales bacterium]